MVMGGTGPMNSSKRRPWIDWIHTALDIDQNTAPDALTDGLMIVRYLFGLRGDPLIGPCGAPRSVRFGHQLAENRGNVAQRFLTERKDPVVERRPVDRPGVEAAGRAGLHPRRLRAPRHGFHDLPGRRPLLPARRHRAAGVRDDEDALHVEQMYAEHERLEGLRRHAATRVAEDLRVPRDETEHAERVDA